MTTEQFLLILIAVFIPIATYYIKRRLEHSLRTEFDRQIEAMRQTFQREMASIKAVYDYKQAAIKSSFEETVKLCGLPIGPIKTCGRMRTCLSQIARPL
jgi:hypothetical protein